MTETIATFVRTRAITQTKETEENDMKQTVKKITSLVLVLALSLVFLPLRADASTISAEKNTETSQTLFRAQGNEISSAVRAELKKRDITVTDDTVVEIVSLGDGKGTAIKVLNSDGNTATAAVLTAIDDEGQPKIFTAADIEQTRYSGGGNATENPFNNTFSVKFMVSFNYYSHGGYTRCLIRPLTAMYIYFDPDQIYTVRALNMDYVCSGIEYTKSGNTYASTGTGQMSHIISISQSTPSRNTYYSNNNNPYPSNKAIYQLGDPGGHQNIVYAYSVIRNSDGKVFTYHNDTDLRLNFPN